MKRNGSKAGKAGSLFATSFGVQQHSSHLAHLLLREAHRGRSPAEELAQSDHLLKRSQRSETQRSLHDHRGLHDRPMSLHSRRIRENTEGTSWPRMNLTTHGNHLQVRERASWPRMYNARASTGWSSSFFICCWFEVFFFFHFLHFFILPSANFHFNFCNPSVQSCPSHHHLLHLRVPPAVMVISVMGTVGTLMVWLVWVWLVVSRVSRLRV